MPLKGNKNYNTIFTDPNSFLLSKHFFNILGYHPLWPCKVKTQSTSPWQSRPCAPEKTDLNVSKEEQGHYEQTPLPRFLMVGTAKDLKSEAVGNDDKPQTEHNHILGCFPVFTIRWGHNGRSLKFTYIILHSFTQKTLPSTKCFCHAAKSQWYAESCVLNQFSAAPLWIAEKPKKWARKQIHAKSWCVPCFWPVPFPQQRAGHWTTSQVRTRLDMVCSWSKDRCGCLYARLMWHTKQSQMAPVQFWNVQWI